MFLKEFGGKVKKSIKICIGKILSIETKMYGIAKKSSRINESISQNFSSVHVSTNICLISITVNTNGL
jgi:hypothetical protein